MSVLVPPVPLPEAGRSAGEGGVWATNALSPVPWHRGKRWLHDAALLAALTLFVQPHLLASDTLISVDSASQFYPWYAFLGQNLMAGHVPGWNPATFSGTPFAANPLSGWTYLPAMLFFGLLPLAGAAKTYLLFHPLHSWCADVSVGRSGTSAQPR